MSDVSAVVPPGVASGTMEAPPSKSYTHRALVGAYFSDGRTRIMGPSRSDDVQRTSEGLRALGATLRTRSCEIEVDPPREGAVSRRTAQIDCGASGTTLRFLAAVASTREVPARFRGSPALARRPVRELLNALHRGGVDVRGPGSRRSLPFTLRGPLRAGRFQVRGTESSQPVSALALVLPTLEGASELAVTGPLVSRPYLDATLAFQHARGIELERTGAGWSFPGGQRYGRRSFRVPGDVSSASYLWAAAALSGGRVRVSSLPRKWPQADWAILPLLRSMGAQVDQSATSATVQGPIRRGFDIDLTDAPDLVPLAVVLAAAVPDVSSHVRGAPQIVHKESDRREGARSLARMFGARARGRHGDLEVVGGRRPRSVWWRGPADHRLVMSAAVGAIGLDGPSRITSPGCVSKSYPGFWQDLARLTRTSVEPR